MAGRHVGRGRAAADAGAARVQPGGARRGGAAAAAAGRPGRPPEDTRLRRRGPKHNSFVLAWARTVSGAPLISAGERTTGRRFWVDLGGLRVCRRSHRRKRWRAAGSTSKWEGSHLKERKLSRTRLKCALRKHPFASATCRSGNAPPGRDGVTAEAAFPGKRFGRVSGTDPLAAKASAAAGINLCPGILLAERRQIRPSWWRRKVIKPATLLPEHVSEQNLEPAALASRLPSDSSMFTNLRRSRITTNNASDPVRLSAK
jgi:hypothetical protein